MNNQIKIERKRAYDRKKKREEKAKSPEKVLARARANYQRIKKDPERLQKHREYQKNYQREYQKKNEDYKEYRRRWMKEWYRKNKDEIYRRRRAKTGEKIAASIRTRMKNVIKLNYKSKSTEKMIGCTTKELKAHIENQFQEGMTWDNYGFYGWHIDHKSPLSSFNLDNLQEREKAFHYSNLQPLWAKDNLEKGAKIKAERRG